MCLINYFTLINNEHISMMFYLGSQLFYLLTFQHLLCGSDLESSPMDICLFLFAAAIPTSQGLCAFANTFYLSSFITVVSRPLCAEMGLALFFQYYLFFHILALNIEHQTSTTQSFDDSSKDPL